MIEVEVEGLDGVLEFPDGTANEVIQRAVNLQLAEQEKLPSLREGGGVARSALGRFGQGFNVSITDLLDLPGELTAAGLRAIGIDIQTGAFRKGAAALGLTPSPGVEPGGRTGAAGRMLGGAVTALVPVIGVGGRAAKATTVAGKIVKEIAESAFRQPARFFAAETAAATAAGVAGFETAKRFPDSEAARVMGELVGGFTPAGVVMAGRAVVSVLGARLARRLAKPFTTSGGRRRARGRVERAVADPERAVRDLDQADVLPEAKLTPAQRIGEREMLALEKSVIDSSAALGMQSDEQIANANRVIREALLETGAAPVSRTRETLQQARDHLTGLLETRLQIAMRRTDRRIAGLGPKANRETANRVARAEIESALKAARQQENDLWGAIPKRVRVGLDETRATYLELLKGRAKIADPEDIPGFVRKALGTLDRKTGKLKGGLFAKFQEINEALVFRSRLLDELAAARATPGSSGPKRKLLNDLQETIIDEDLTLLAGRVDEEVRASVDLARNFSKDLNDRFTRGPVGRLLGTGRDRGPRTVEGLTLEVTVGRGGPVGREAADALAKAVERSGDSPAMQAAIEDFLKSEFLRRAVKDGKIVKSQSDSFMKQFDDVLDRYPELRQDFEGAIESNRTADLAQRRLTGITKGLDDPRISRSAIFLKAPVGREIDRVMASNNPRATMAELARQTGRDPTGEALEGLKAGLGDWLLRNAETGVTDVSGEFSISGKRLLRLLNTSRVKSALAPIFTGGERSRLMRIAQTAVRIEKASAAKPATEGVIGDVPSGLVDLVGRIGGAQVGRAVAARTGGGTVQTPGIISTKVREALARGVRDPAKKLIIDAVGDETLFRALLTEATTSQKEAFVRKQLNAWLAGILVRELGEDADETTSAPRSIHPLTRVTVPGLKVQSGDLSQIPLDEITRRLRSGTTGLNEP